MLLLSTLGTHPNFTIKRRRKKRFKVKCLVYVKRITYSNAKATSAQVTTIPSRMFQPSRQNDPGCKMIPKSTIYEKRGKLNNNGKSCKNRQQNKKTENYKLLRGSGSTVQKSTVKNYFEKVKLFETILPQKDN